MKNYLSCTRSENTTRILHEEQVRSPSEVDVNATRSASLDINIVARKRKHLGMVAREPDLNVQANICRVQSQMFQYFATVL